MKALSTVGLWGKAEWKKAWNEIASLCGTLAPNDERLPRVKSYLELFDQEYQWKDAEWFYWALTRFRNGFKEKGKP